MSEVLSQHEIDALLSAISSGDMEVEEIRSQEEERRVKVYDFKRALRFSKDQMRNLTRIHEQFARVLTTHFSAQLRTYVQFTVNTVEQLPYDEFIHSIPNMTLINLVNLHPLDGRVIFEVNPNIAYAMLDRLLGGPGEGMNKIENLTEIETRILTQLFKRAFVQYGAAWESIAEIEAEYDDLEINPQFLQLVSPNETVILVSIYVTVGEVSGTLNVCLPFVTLEPIIPKLSSHFWMQQEKRKSADNQESEHMQTQLMGSIVDLKAVLGQTELSFGELLHLEVGDCLSLQTRTSDPVELFVDDRKMFKARPGLNGKHLALQVLQRIEEE
ncbi:MULTISPECIES: flagellar motor switch protein FliM [Exiguobacterium]|jgi:flagellar motor switch protein FliM|uniref:Flagellar motor switch protein FliM n=3 Tax=Exiguobacterium TaxID=33986 RepID=B1YI93_EXIS2|nr:MULTISPECIES: flagellar motor switch protein FliM [Exiguobacterium]ACB61320.1 flagellar motor switch protein FliM [Exiguobacterium sibiricum 255-15]AFS70827.1 Flagellar motor switch protein FliM [Exiguobacterium antarcticum B7]MCT4781086.1 flagellar motor switch protein FliM [Exiguobacterium soli]MCT4791556.1 flagellar motor switch protein FliM [Exiguobacterium artemiae]MDI3233860.1 flagellar motor switch protein FliM [Exiguobacterium antarcticum]